MATTETTGERPACVDMGWGRLIFGAAASFESAAVARLLCAEAEGERDIAFQLRDPHVLIAQAPHELFLDPSHTYRLREPRYAPSREPCAVEVRVACREDGPAIDRVLARRQMVTFGEHVDDFGPAVEVLVALDPGSGEVIGTVTAVDHVRAYDDPAGGSSLWCLAVDPDAPLPGVGECLVRALCERSFARGRQFVDLSVMHDNDGAIRLYDKLGFERVQEFTVKRRNPINEPLFVAPRTDERMNPYAEIIVDEARLRGIGVEIIDAERALFELRLGGRAIRCRESLSDLTSAVALQLCDDKRATRAVFHRAGLRVPEQRDAGDGAAVAAMLERHGSVVVKPSRGEQGRGVTVGVRSAAVLERAVTSAREVCPDVLVEQQVEGEDLRVIVIGGEVAAAALRRPPRVAGVADRTVRELVDRYDRRRRAATGGESRVPLDAETARCVAEQGFGLDDVVPAGVEVTLRRTANLHTGGTIHDVTDDLHPALADAALRAAGALGIPVVGLDLMVRSPAAPDYHLIEANERPGLANHEPQPTAERFVDLLFPQTARARSGVPS